MDQFQKFTGFPRTATQGGRTSGGNSVRKEEGNAWAQGEIECSSELDGISIFTLKLWDNRILQAEDHKILGPKVSSCLFCGTLVIGKQTQIRKIWSFYIFRTQIKFVFVLIKKKHIHPWKYIWLRNCSPGIRVTYTHISFIHIISSSFIKYVLYVLYVQDMSFYK